MAGDVGTWEWRGEEREGRSRPKEGGSSVSEVPESHLGQSEQRGTRSYGANSRDSKTSESLFPLAYGSVHTPTLWCLRWCCLSNILKSGTPEPPYLCFLFKLLWLFWFTAFTAISKMAMPYICESLLMKDARETTCLYKRKKLSSGFLLQMKFNSKWIKFLNVRPKTIELLRKHQRKAAWHCYHKDL